MLHAVQHHHPPAALGRGEAQEVGDAADVIDHDLAAPPPPLLVPGALDRQQIGVRSGGDAAEHGMRGIEVERRGGTGEQPTGEAEGQRRLAHAFRPGDQPGVVDAPRAHRLQDRRLRRRLAEQQRVGARLGQGHDPSPNSLSAPGGGEGRGGGNYGSPSQAHRR